MSQSEFFEALMAMLGAVAVLKDASQDSAASMFKKLQASVMTKSGIDDTLDEIPRLAIKLWTSFDKGIKDKEFCSLLNDVISSDIPGVAFDNALKLTRSMNTLLVTRRAKAQVQWPPQWTSYRGVGMPRKEVGRFAVGVTYRCTRFLATAFQERVANDFLKRVKGDMVQVLIFFRLDAEKTCNHALYLEKMTLVPGERELLYVPYSVFTPTKIEIPDVISWETPVKIYLNVAPDNLNAPKELPLIDWH